MTRRDEINLIHAYFKEGKSISFPWEKWVKLTYLVVLSVNLIESLDKKRAEEFTADLFSLFDSTTDIDDLSTIDAQIKFVQDSFIKYGRRQRVYFEHELYEEDILTKIDRVYHETVLRKEQEAEASLQLLQKQFDLEKKVLEDIRVQQVEDVKIVKGKEIEGLQSFIDSLKKENEALAAKQTELLTTIEEQVKIIYSLKKGE